MIDGSGPIGRAALGCVRAQTPTHQGRLRPITRKGISERGVRGTPRRDVRAGPRRRPSPGCSAGPRDPRKARDPSLGQTCTASCAWSARAACGWRPCRPPGPRLARSRIGRGAPSPLRRSELYLRPRRGPAAGPPRLHSCARRTAAGALGGTRELQHVGRVALVHGQVTYSTLSSKRGFEKGGEASQVERMPRRCTALSVRSKEQGSRDELHKGIQKRQA